MFILCLAYAWLLSDYNRGTESHRAELVAVATEAPKKAAKHHTPIAATADGSTRYVAVAGDTVRRLARRFLGANTKTNRDAIIAMNPSLRKNPNNVKIGMTYVIPQRAKS